MHELLVAYLKVTREIEALDWMDQPDALEQLLDQRDSIIRALEPHIPKPGEGQDPESLALVEEIETLENALRERFEAHLTQLTEEIQNVKDEQAVQVKNRRAYQRYFSKPADQPSVYFDEKK